ncbi:MAG TPA: 30S ribosomal protein S12 methylthiotransferase RimO [Coriobacteriia bacterium]
MPRLKVHFVTLGCPKNEVDSDRMAARVVSSAYALEPELHAADVAVVNTCAFIQAATEESVETVLTLAAEWKAARPGRTLVVAGCLASRYGAELAAEMPEVDAFVPVDDEDALLSLLERLSGQPAEASEGSPPRTAGGASAYLQVADGCFHRCTYCTIPFIRGGYRSRPLDDLAGEARLLIASGVKELVLVGQDISSYGRDLGEGSPSLAEVVRALARTEGLEWLRLMYVQPDGITPELLEVMAEEAAVCHYLDVPLQHASRQVLHAMARPGSGDEFLRLLGVVRSWLPDVALRTTLIAGFPGETDTDVEVLEDFLLLARFDYAGVFEYSREEGTRAADLPGQVPAEAKRLRAQRLRDAADSVGFEKAAAHTGETLEVLALGLEDGEPFGRTRGQAPEVDGVVYLDAEAPEGAVVRARIVDSAGYDLVGEVQR